MSEPDQLAPLLEAVGITENSVGPDDIARLCGLLGLSGDDALVDEVIDEIARSHATDGDPAHDEYGFRVGQWKIEAGAGGVRAGILMAIAAAALIQRGIGEIGVAFATAVLPTVLDVERIELEPGDRRLLIDLRLKPGIRDGFATEDELYNSLPADTRRTINRYDFADFIQRLREAGMVDGDKDKDWLHVRDPDAKQPLIKFK